MLIDAIEATDREDILAELAEVISDAETTVMNTLAYGLHTTMILHRDPGMEGQHGSTSSGDIGFAVPIVSIDPYPHHIVASVELMRKSIDRSLAAGKIARETHRSLSATLERTLDHLPQSSKSVQAARTEHSYSLPDSL
jgi:hypothetical protein